MLLPEGHLLVLQALPLCLLPCWEILITNECLCFYYVGNFSGFVLLWLRGVSLFQLLIAYSTKRISEQIKDHAKTLYPHKYICQKTTSRNQLQSLPVSLNHDENQREPVRPMWFASCFFTLGPDASDGISMSLAIGWLPSPSPPLTSIPAFLGPLQLWSSQRLSFIVNKRLKYQV